MCSTFESSRNLDLSMIMLKWKINQIPIDALCLYSVSVAEELFIDVYKLLNNNFLLGNID